MITRLLKTESQVYMHPAEMRKQQQINIAYDFSLEEPRLIKSKTSEGYIINIEYKFSIIYTNPAMGYLRYEGEIDCPENIKKAEDVTEEIKSKIAHMVMLDILPMALLSSRSMGLPPAVPLPFPPNRRATDKQETGTGGMYG